MNFSTVNRIGENRVIAGLTRSTEIRRSKSIELILVFVFLGVGLSAIVSAFAGTSHGILIAAAVILLAAPAVVLAMHAIPQGLAMARNLAHDWQWWNPLWFLIFFSTLVFRIRDVGEAQSTPIDSYAMLRLIPEALVSLALIIRLVLKKPNWLGTLFHGIPAAMMIYCLICLATTPFSVNAPWTAYKSLEFLLDVSLLAAIVAGAEGFATYENLLNGTLVLYGLSLVGVWINLAIWPADAMDGDRLTGVFPVEASNSVGTSGAVLAIIAICRLMPVFIPSRTKNRAWYLLLLTFGVISMVMSKTRSAEAAFLIAVLMVIAFTPGLRRIALWSSVIVTPIVAVAVYLNDRLTTEAWNFLAGVALRDQPDTAIESLTGRTEWWQYGISQLMHHPWTGLGAYAGGRFAVLGKLGVGSAAMMHSDWIEILIGTSIWGLIPFAAALIAAWWFLFRCVGSDHYQPEHRQLALELLAILGMLTMHSFFNDELSWHCPLLYFSILGYAEFLRGYQKREASYTIMRQPLGFARV
jgi:O-antigen ligase